MAQPQNTYRIQFHQDFTLSDLDKISEYLTQLGVDTIYASPLLAAAPGSTHGYDGINSHRINPEIGTKKQLLQLSKKLKAQHMHWLQDIVPNHMAFHPDNDWLMNVLEYGENSPYKNYFDTSLSSDLMDGKLMVPVLGKSLRQAFEDEEITIQYKKGHFYVQYFEQHFPLAPSSYPFLLQNLLPDFEPREALEESIKQLQSSGEELVDKTTFEALSTLFSGAKKQSQLQGYLRHLNKDIDALSALLELQHYRLCHWQETDKQINYRRFFTVNGLICMQVDRQEVFEDTHALIKELLAENVFDGLRIDHIDGLYNPSKYLRDLRQLAGPDTYIIAEKILEHGEDLPESWPIQGATGYEFLAWCNNVLTDKKSKKALTRFYGELTGIQDDVHSLQLKKKADIVSKHLGGEIDNLYRYLLKLELLPQDVSYGSEEIKKIISALLIYFPTYRLYDESFPISAYSYDVLQEVFGQIIADKFVSKKLAKAFAAIFEKAQYSTDELIQQKTSLFFARYMQFAGPVMAKGVEDTLMYTYHRHIGRHEVGDHPENFGLSKKAFHRAMADRQKKWPAALNGSATHDTKRGEDQRARLQVLTAIPEIWISHVASWEALIKENYAATLPHPNDRYFLYQTLFGSYPMADSAFDDYDTRLDAYLEKYLREGKERSDWAMPDEAYEDCLKAFAFYLLDQNQSFFQNFHTFLLEYVDFGIINSLNQVILKFTCPGIPDVYQGSELWELGFVDPDNRRPVDYAIRQEFLTEIKSSSWKDQLPALWKDRHSGKIKLALIHHLLQLRSNHAEIFNDGKYMPVQVAGKYKRHILAYARQYQEKWIVVVLPLHLASIATSAKDEYASMDWEDTCIVLPTNQEITWDNNWNAATIANQEIAINELFAEIPIGILHGKSSPKQRGAGVVLHITSLPSDYGIGDLGEEAYQFADQLEAAGQHWWQVLPLGPTSKDQFHSPYSTWSAMAGNPLLIDLSRVGISQQRIARQLEELKKPKKYQVDFDHALALKMPLLYEAFEQVELQTAQAFNQFCKKESKWLNDYALYVVLREKQGNLPWYAWDTAYKSRDPAAIKSFAEQHKDAILFQKWLQYVFDEQWRKLRRYCHARNISILGDIPIYVSHDSADVWAHPALFALHDDGSLQAVAGVPPDYFNADGQLWGMPVFNWKTHQKSGFKWWIDRIARNVSWYDKIRLDHFRAFSAYWEVPADAESAQFGTWQEAPGKQLFAKIKNVFGQLPFIAEDLGDIDAAVYALRDSENMPGMKVLQFAFGEDIATSPHIPHQYKTNYVVYTGTHDNNTTKGWYEQETDESMRKRIRAYAGNQVNAQSINDTLIRMAYSSQADLAIVPMQDILDLDGNARMNTPATTKGNWSWQMTAGDFNPDRIKMLREWVAVFNRG